MTNKSHGEMRQDGEDKVPWGMATNKEKRDLLGQQLWHAMERGSEQKAISLINTNDLAHCVHPQQGYYPLSAAARWGLLGVCRALLNKGANPNSQDYGSEDTPLYSAIVHGGRRLNSTAIIEKILAAGGDLNLYLPERGGASVFMVACGTGMREAPRKLKIMLDHGGRVGAVDGRGRGIMHYAATTNPGIIRLLRKAGAQANIQDDDGNTALHAAAETGSASCFQALLVAGADPRTPNNHGLTALECGVREAEVGESEVGPMDLMVARWVRKQLGGAAREARSAGQATRKGKTSRKM